jgi:hypothetical protein
VRCLAGAQLDTPSPEGFRPPDGYGLLIDGYEFRPAMTI